MAAIDLEDVTKRFGDHTVAVDSLTLTVNDGEFMIFVGPSGCGKTTALRMIAGLEEMTSGSIHIGGRLVNDLPPSRRDVAMVFQNYALYPHMTVADNIGFPLKKQKLSRREKEEKVAAVADLLSIRELLGRKPRELSGGQRQRVAMGRALIRNPQAFLMDEPLSNLDAKLRVQMRAELVSLHQRLGVTTVYVTHDQTEAMTLGERVAVLNRGVIQQVDTPQRLYRHPANVFVASFIGSPVMNFLQGRLDRDEVAIGPYRIPLPPETSARLLARPDTVVVGLRPEDIVPAGPGGESLPAEVAITEQLGPETIAYLRIPGVDVIEDLGERPVGLSGTVSTRLEGSSDVRPGSRCDVAVRAERLHLYDPATGDSLLGAPQLARHVASADA
jgi:multiple sugar transport system ATP-binding protein